MPELAVRGTLTEVGWEPSADLTEDEWKAVGETLGRMDRSVSWWIGDWWAFGEHSYGDRKAIVERPEWSGPGFQACRDAAFVARAFSMSRRRDVLSFSHHREVAALEPAEADALLDLAEANRWSKLGLRGEVHRRNVTIGAQPSAQTGQVEDLFQAVAGGRKWGCIYADPPWLYDNQGTRASTGNHYRGMTIEELCLLPVKALAADDAHLHLWTTNGFLFEAPRLFKAWGFEFRSSLIWIKPQMGIGNYWRNSHEILLTAIRGKAKRFNDHSLMSWFQCDRGAHSAKPEQVRDMLRRASPGPYLELFARRRAEGWDSWGDQLEHDLFSGERAA